MLILFLICIPFVELYLFIQFGSQIGALTTVMWVLLTMVIGWFILKFQGFTTLSTGYDVLTRYEALAVIAPVLNEFVMMLGAILLIIPGFLTDSVGILCLIPFMRQFLLTHLFARMMGHRSSHFRVHRRHQTHNPRSDNASDVIEGEYRRRQ